VNRGWYADEGGFEGNLLTAAGEKDPSNAKARAAAVSSRCARLCSRWPGLNPEIFFVASAENTGRVDELYSSIPQMSDEPDLLSSHERARHPVCAEPGVRAHRPQGWTDVRFRGLLYRKASKRL